MHTVFNFFIERWRVALSLTLILSIIGVAGVVNMNKQAFPSVNTGTIVIASIYPGGSAKEVKDEVTRILSLIHI